MSQPMRVLVLCALIVVLTGCSDTAPSAPAPDGSAAMPAPMVLAQARGKPTRSPLPPAEDLEVPPGVWCSFGVFVHDIVNNQVIKTFPPEPNGDIVQLITGRYVTSLTNTSTGKSIKVNISGPARVTTHPDGSVTLVATGRWFLADITGASLRAFISSGRVVISIAPDGSNRLVSRSGRQRDICALLS
jgi:hypothetical protein